MIRLVALLAGLTTGCAPAVCGTAEFLFVYEGGEGEMFDIDGDGDADFVERCGVDLGSYGYSRDDYGITELILPPDTHEDTIEANSDMTLYVLGSGSLVFLTSHLEVGVKLGIDELAGTGMHKLGGTAADIYSTYDLLDGTLEVLEGPRPSTGIVYEGSDEWKLRWNLTYGDPMNRTELQWWDAEDWVRIGPGSTIGEPVDLPPDWTAPA